MGDTLEDVIAEVRTQCDGEFQRWGLTGPTLNRANTYFSLGYFGNAVGLQILVDFDGFFVHFLPFRVSKEGELPVGYEDASNRVQKMYLIAAMKKLGMPCENEHAELKRLGGDHRNCAAMVTILLALTKRAWRVIVARTEALVPTARTDHD